MKFSSIFSLWRIQCFKFGKRISVSRTGSAVTLGSVQRTASLGSNVHGGSSLLRQLFWKFKSLIWKQALGYGRSSTARFSYDLHSYSLNFDDGFSNDHRLSFHDGDRTGSQAVEEERTVFWS
ncbi:hypothetical protein FNV43_RR23189 [Rhamnella rubrinervis]|uniref:Uncharacterized protein n=1 Tax=Rhamnella rubrinervis TaxID=2594499 RepID=A0A8K0DRI8_9ROSA|nr:hypothetical protein FNV43_RR23189 [Rhamnella rubrinervis]